MKRYYYLVGSALVIIGINSSSPLDMKVTEVASLIGAKWRELEDDEKKPYEDKAAKDRQRYDKEMQQYNQGTFQVR